MDKKKCMNCDKTPEEVVIKDENRRELRTEFETEEKVTNHRVEKN